MVTARIETSEPEPPLPSTATTFDGIVFDPRQDIWELRTLSRQRLIRFDIFDRLSNTVVHRLKWAMLLYLQNKSIGHSINLHDKFKAFYLSVLQNSETIHHRVELSHILTFKSQLHAATEWKLGVVRILLIDMKDLGFGITADDAIEYLANATIRGNIKGTSVRTRDAESGAFADTELLAIQSALNDAYATGDIGLNEFAITWLFLAYGPRSIQIAALKEKDLIVSEGDDGRTYALRIPRAKQRGERARDSFKTRHCGKQVGTLLARVIKDNQHRRRKLGLTKNDCPMFIKDSAGTEPGLLFHMTTQDIGRVVSGTIGRITGMKTNARRFRITLAQRAVDDGKDKHTVAELLDHSDTQNVEVYYEASPAMVLRLDRHLAMEMAPIAHAFAGVIVTTESEARRGEDRSSRIFDRSLSNNVADALGTCGQMSFCGLAAPFACYTCRHFQPWLDGPHEEFMQALILDRDRLESEGYSAKIYTIRDRTILAVAEVIRLCAVETEIGAEAAA
ncbi:site-specific integrase [Sinorhizobium medicae]|nr:site-specific integrase [Sinorhizobium medicae]MDX0874447.1 site-specific integrase [Sinorhizobium medicae]